MPAGRPRINRPDTPFGKNLRRIVADRGMRCQDAALAIGTSHQKFSYWCCGKNDPSLYYLCKLKEFLDVPWDELLGGVYIES